MDQMDDEDEERSADFREGLQNYLGLSSPLAPFGHENVNHLVGDDGFKETIDICEKKYRDLRLQMLDQGRKSAAWIREKFVLSKDVIVANKDHFLSTLDSWSIDPCESGAVASS